jgi:hypothetical protein
MPIVFSLLSIDGPFSLGRRLLDPGLDQNFFGRDFNFIQGHKLNQLAGTKPVETGIAGNLERQMSFDDSHFGSFHRPGIFPLGSRHGSRRGKCRGQQSSSRRIGILNEKFALGIEVHHLTAPKGQLKEAARSGGLL